MDPFDGHGGSQHGRHATSAGAGQGGTIAAGPPLPGPVPSAGSWIDYVPGPLVRVLAELGGLTQLAVEVVWSVIRRPTGYWRAVRDEMYSVLRLSWFPMALAVLAFSLMIGILGMNVTELLGANNRYGQYFFIQNIREFAQWVNSMVVAGIVGAAVCSDLGARKVREELDALRVLGTNPVRELVLPRVVSTTILTPLLLQVSLVVGLLCGLFSSVTYGDVPAGDYYATVFKNLTTIELVVAVAKGAAIGFVIGLVGAYKGLNAGGGPLGVGRAVNQAVVFAFALVFIIDLAFNMIALGLFPSLQTVR
jgi:phospholipid/cholesterol/gamma-HCH transport system permease protein